MSLKWTRHRFRARRLRDVLRATDFHGVRFAIYVLRVDFGGQPMTKFGIVHSGSLSQRLRDHLRKHHYRNVQLLGVWTLDVARPLASHAGLSDLVCATEANVKRELRRANRLPPTTVPGTRVCETEVVRRADERFALASIARHTNRRATRALVADHCRHARRR